MSSTNHIPSPAPAQGQAKAPLLTSRSSVTPTADKGLQDDPQKSRGPLSASSLQSSSVVEDSGAGVAEARSSEDGCASALSEAKLVLIHFLEDYLEIRGLFIGFQSRFGHGSDLILFRAPQTGSTLAVECNVMLERRGRALQIIQEKIIANQKQWAT
jgi:hypothetical protein